MSTTKPPHTGRGVHALLILANVLRDLPPDRVVAARDGKDVTAAMMLAEIEAETDYADEYTRQLLTASARFWLRRRIE